MEERNILSREEVDAIIKSAQSSSELEANEEAADSPSSNINTHALEIMMEHACAGLENKLTVLLRKKIVVKSKPAVQMTVEDYSKLVSENFTFSSFRLMPYNSPTVISIQNRFIDVITNLLYGGTVDSITDGSIKVGKVGLLTSEKISRMSLESFVDATKEHGDLLIEYYKTATTLNTANNIRVEDLIYSIEISIMIDEIESVLQLNFTDEFLIKIIPMKTGKGKHKEKDFWRSAIKTEVMDSYVTITTNMADLKMNLKDFLNMKEGDEVQIGDPTLVFVCLNELKLYRALAGQANSNLVVKIVSQV
jgi:flagellar motor switch protein FliM